MLFQPPQKELSDQEIVEVLRQTLVQVGCRGVMFPCRYLR